MSGTCGCDSVACICEDIAAAEMIAERHDAEQRSLAAKLAAAEARAEKAEGEVRYLRALMAWMAARADLGNRTGGHGLRDYIDWLDANPEPQPPPGVEP